jgi:1,6-anhydro-N-acetylmuramate kinase
MKDDPMHQGAPPVWAIGLMTGTALDGYVDAALIRTDGNTIAELGPYGLFPYSDDDRKILSEAITQARAWSFAGPRPIVLHEAEAVITRVYARAVQSLLAQAGMEPQDVALVGGHGLTVLHRPEIGKTLQLPWRMPLGLTPFMIFVRQMWQRAGRARPWRRSIMQPSSTLRASPPLVRCSISVVSPM